MFESNHGVDEDLEEMNVQSVQVYGVNGVLLKETKTQGVYVVRYVTDKGVIVRKIIVVE